jgi:hypothetical protein
MREVISSGLISSWADREEYQWMMITNLVLPRIKKKMPINNNIIVHQDGAKAHLLVDHPEFKAKVQELYGNKNAVKLYTQPAQSPDLNVKNDLGFFASLQSMYYRTSPKNSSIDLIEMVESCFNKYDVNKVNRIWLSLQCCMKKNMIEEKGDKKYTIPHMNKERLERLNQLPVSIAVTQEAQHNYDLNILVG